MGVSHFKVISYIFRCILHHLQEELMYSLLTTICFHTTIIFADFVEPYCRFGSEFRVVYTWYSYS